MSTSHTGTSRTCGIGIVQRCHWERPRMSWVGMLHGERQKDGGKEFIQKVKEKVNDQKRRKENGRKEGGQKQYGRSIWCLKKKKELNICFTETSWCHYHAVEWAHMLHKTRHVNDKEVKRCQTPDCSKKRNLWWLISDSIDIWTQRKRGYIVDVSLTSSHMQKINEHFHSALCIRYLTNSFRSIDTLVRQCFADLN